MYLIKFTNLCIADDNKMHKYMSFTGKRLYSIRCRCIKTIYRVEYIKRFARDSFIN